MYIHMYWYLLCLHPSSLYFYACAALSPRPCSNSRLGLPGTARLTEISSALLANKRSTSHSFQYITLRSLHWIALHSIPCIHICMNAKWNVKRCALVSSKFRLNLYQDFVQQNNSRRPRKKLVCKKIWWETNNWRQLQSRTKEDTNNWNRTGTHV